MGEYAEYGFDQQGWYGMFVACGIWCLADVSSGADWGIVVIPKGFRTNFHASNFSISCNRYFQDIDQACNTFSKKRHESHYQSYVNQTPRTWPKDSNEPFRT